MEKTTLNKNEKKNIRTMYFRKKKYLQIFRNILVEEIYQKIDRKIINAKY